MPWAYHLNDICRLFRIMPSAGGAYDQDLELINAILYVQSAEKMSGLDAEGVFKLPKALKNLRTLLITLSEA